MKRKHLYAVAAAIWGIPAIIITLKGINAYLIQPSENLWWLLLITAAVMTAFFLMFRRIVDRYCNRIAALPDKVKIWQGNRSQAYPCSPYSIYSFILQRSGSDAPSILSKIYEIQILNPDLSDKQGAHEELHRSTF